MVHLREISGPESHANAKTGNAVGEVDGRVSLQTVRRGRATGLQPPIYAPFPTKNTKSIEIGPTQRLQVTQHHGSNAIANSQFNLGYTHENAQCDQHIAQRHYHVRYMLGQYMAFLHVGHVRRGFLVKAHKKTVFLDHETGT